MKKKLKRSTENKMLLGVCSGIADYFDLDPTVVRVALAFFGCCGGAGVLLYIVGALLMPGDTEESAIEVAINSVVEVEKNDNKE